MTRVRGEPTTAPRTPGASLRQQVHPVPARPGDTAGVTSPPTIATHLERDRLAHRARRIELVLAALKERAVYRSGPGGRTPAPLERAIADFGIELRRLRRRLAELPH